MVIRVDRRAWQCSQTQVSDLQACNTGRRRQRRVNAVEGPTVDSSRLGRRPWKVTDRDSEILNSARLKGLTYRERIAGSQARRKDDYKSSAGR